MKRSEKIPVQDPNDVKITETCHAQDSFNNLSKSNAVLNNINQSQSNCFATENNPNPKVNLLACLKKRKTVKISKEIDEHEIEIDEHEIENEDIEAERTETDAKKGPKGRLITDVKYVKTDCVNNLQDVNQCKNQWWIIP